MGVLKCLNILIISICLNPRYKQLLKDSFEFFLMFKNVKNKDVIGLHTII